MGDLSMSAGSRFATGRQFAPFLRWLGTQVAGPLQVAAPEKGDACGDFTSPFVTMADNLWASALLSRVMNPGSPSPRSLASGSPPQRRRPRVRSENQP